MAIIQFKIWYITTSEMYTLEKEINVLSSLSYGFHVQQSKQDE